jgi:hypothetical protein
VCVIPYIFLHVALVEILIGTVTVLVPFLFTIVVYVRLNQPRQSNLRQKLNASKHQDIMISGLNNLNKGGMHCTTCGASLCMLLNSLWEAAALQDL